MLCPSEISKGETNGVDYGDRTVAVRNRRRWHKIQAVKLPGKRVPCFLNAFKKHCASRENREFYVKLAKRKFQKVCLCFWFLEMCLGLLQLGLYPEIKREYYLVSWR